MPQFIFLDTEAYEAESFNTESTHFKALAKHLESRRLRLVITDITKTEVHKRIDKRCREELESLFSGFRGRCQNFDLYKFRNCVITSA